MGYLNIRHEGSMIPTECLSPYFILDGHCLKTAAPGSVRISCGRCTRCVITRKNMIVGRVLATMATSKQSLMLTLTYRDGPDGPPLAAKELDKSHMIAFKRSLRHQLNKYDYIGVSEVGARTNRVHFHMVLALGENSKIPLWAEFPVRAEWDYRLAKAAGKLLPDNKFETCGIIGQRLPRGNGHTFVAHLPGWPHGHVDIKTADQGSAGYVAKYLLKEEDQKTLHGKGFIDRGKNHEKYVTRSQNLGVEHIRNIARQMARETGHVPKNTYFVPGSAYKRGPRAGRPIPYTMTRAMKIHYALAYLNELVLLIATDKIPAWNPNGGANFAEETNVITWFLNRDAQRDPRFHADKLFAEFHRKSVQKGAIARVVSGAFPKIVKRREFPQWDGEIRKDEFGQVWWCWPDLSGSGDSIHLPIPDRATYDRLLQVGPWEPLGLIHPHHPKHLRPRNALQIHQVAERNGSGVLDDWERENLKVMNAAQAVKRARWSKQNPSGVWPDDLKDLSTEITLLRAYVTRSRWAEIRDATTEAIKRSWSPTNEQLAFRGIGWPATMKGKTLHPSQIRQYPAYAAALTKALSNGPP